MQHDTHLSADSSPLGASPIHRALAEHQVLGTKDWNLHQVIAELHEWAEVFRLRFKLEIAAVPLRITALRWNCLGHFNPGFNDFGLTDEIAIDVGHVHQSLLTGRWWEVLATLLHEQLHYWQKRFGKPAAPGPGNYHNVEFRAKAHVIGLIVTARGAHDGYVHEGPFLALLKERGVRVPHVPPPNRRQLRVGSKLKKWCCGCTNVRVAVGDFRARCLKCGGLFQRA